CFEKTDEYDAATALNALNHNNTAYNKWFYNKVVDSASFSQNPGLFISYAISKLPFVIFFYLPVFALFIWLAYMRHKLKYMEHLVFAFHVQTIFFILFSIAILIAYFTDSTLILNLTCFIFLGYMYKSMRRFYGQGRFKTAIKFVFLNIIFLTLAGIATVFATFFAFLIY
ncbi:MAG: hypothetical protein V7767_15590, partial [Leeuwenhoekiella sp.]